MTKAENLDPLSLIINADLAELFLRTFLTSRQNRAAKPSRWTLTLPLRHNQLAQAYLQKHMFRKQSRNWRKRSRFPEEARHSPPIWLAPTRQEKRGGRATERSEETLGPWHAYAAEIAMIYAALGDKDQAMIWLERAMKSDLTRASSCGPALIRYAPTRASKTLCTALAYPGQICIPSAVTSVLLPL